MSTPLCFIVSTKRQTIDRRIVKLLTDQIVEIVKVIETVETGKVLNAKQ
jgi:hypothetical protein